MVNTRKVIGILSAILGLFLWGCSSDQTEQILKPPSLPSPSPSVSPTPKSSPLTLLPSTQSDPKIRQIIQQYLQQLTQDGFSPKQQAVWFQTSTKFLTDFQGKQPLPAASLTKVATSLVALNKLGIKHQFVTKIGIQGTIINGTLNGDLIIEGGQDPLFIWEDAIIVANLLKDKGLKQINGNLIILDKFYMNFEMDSQKSGVLLREAFNAQMWSEEVRKQYETLPPNIPKPQLEITGEVQVKSSLDTPIKPWVNYYSLSLPELLKKMNQYSNNMMADVIGDVVGGVDIIENMATQLAGVSPGEIQLVNSSGLSEENQMSPRAVVGLFLAIQEYLKPYRMNIADIFTLTGTDPGVLSQRKDLPIFLVLKSGTLDQVSALGGAIPTKNQGVIWFTILNGGTNIEKLRQDQEVLLHKILKEGDLVKILPSQLKPNSLHKKIQPRYKFISQ